MHQLLLLYTTATLSLTKNNNGLIKHSTRLNILNIFFKRFFSSKPLINSNLSYKYSLRKLNNLHSRSRKYSTKGNRGRYRAIIVPRCELYYSLRILSSYLGNQRAYAAKFNEFASRASCSFEGRNFSIPSGKRERERRGQASF